MTQLKVGDRVRQVKDSMWRGIEGVYDGRREDGSWKNEGTKWDYFIPDEGSHYSNGDRCTFAGKPCGMSVDSFELIAPDRLTRLEAFVARVAELDRFNVGKFMADVDALVAELNPVDPDEAEAIAIANEDGWTAEIIEGNACSSILKAIKRGRALERGEP